MPFPVDKKIEGYQVEYGPDLLIVMYIVNLSKKPFTDSLSYLRNCGFYILIFESFFQVTGTQHYLGIGLYTVTFTLFDDGRVDFTYGQLILLHDIVQEIEIYGSVLATHQEGQ